MVSDELGTNAAFVVLGAGGHAASVADVIASTGSHVEFFIGDGSPFAGARVDADESHGLQEAERRGWPLMVAIGDNAVRAAVIARLGPEGLAPAVFASSATVSILARVSRGTVIHHHAHVGPGATIGAGVIVNTSAVVEHDAFVGDGVHLAPGAIVLGGAQIGPQTFVGAGARILPGIHVGADARVGAGAVVTRDVAAGATVIGLPARRLEGNR